MYGHDPAHVREEWSLADCERLFALHEYERARRLP